ncbi:oxygenase MpaB family protein [Gordonia sp. (in: high G+C Gram-positive bacteria)]|uniref:oxygenase MpaB family protein n=1 Tax=Gordonia sp. (in: high G+C Gram-positive bacteria) TaxID=84139 RepID=UPI00261A621C|nr:oxygenase MpaB family protein [Gordonia sp. (in: high G+C Gram-positive bacteria)]
MHQLNRRTVVRGGAALGAGALLAAGQASPWTWSPAASVPGAGTGADPRTTWDPECDEIVAELARRGRIPEVNALLRSWTQNGQPLPAGLPADLRDFLTRARRPPAWTDPGKLAAATAFNAKRGTYLGALYGFASGMMSTVIPHEARAVYYSWGGAAMKDRISKTAKLGYDIGTSNAYQSTGEMTVTCIKTRLAHSGVRALLPKSPYWAASAEQKLPISQADMMVTWHSLPTTVMRLLKVWQVPVDDAESAGFLHSWQLAGHYLGIRDEYLPATWAAARAQAKQMLDPVLAPTPEGIKLADMLLNLGHELDLSLLSRGVLGALTRFMLGDTIADWLRIPREPVWTPLLETSWGPFIAVREGLLEIGTPPAIYWTFDEILRQFVLLYMSELRLPINIAIPTQNNPHYR